MTKKPNETPSSALPSEEKASLSNEIDRQIGDLVPQKARKQVVERLTNITAVQINEHFSGPLPHPRHLEHYEQISPGAADRILGMAEKQLEHRHKIDRMIVSDDIKDRKRGMYSGGGLFALLIIFAFAIAILTQDALLTAPFLGTAVIGAIGQLINGRK